jgi:hypothetical protein
MTSLKKLGKPVLYLYTDAGKTSLHERNILTSVLNAHLAAMLESTGSAELNKRTQNDGYSVYFGPKVYTNMAFSLGAINPTLQALKKLGLQILDELKESAALSYILIRDPFTIQEDTNFKEGTDHYVVGCRALFIPKTVNIEEYYVGI